MEAYGRSDGRRPRLQLGCTARPVSGALSTALIVTDACSGPHTTGWLGWQGGAQMFKHKTPTGHRTEIEIAQAVDSETASSIPMTIAVQEDDPSLCQLSEMEKSKGKSK